MLDLLGNKIWYDDKVGFVNPLNNKLTIGKIVGIKEEFFVAVDSGARANHHLTKNKLMLIERKTNDR